MEATIRYADAKPVSKRQHINLKWPERYVSIIVGVKIGWSGVKHLFSSPLTSILKIGTGGYLLNRGVTGHCEFYDMAGKTGIEAVDIAIRTSVTVNKPRAEVYDFWRKLDNLPLFMQHLKSVEVINEQESKWSFKLPADIAAITWDAVITYDEPGNMIAWESLPDAMIQNSGKVRFIDTTNQNQTLVHVAISYQPPAGGVGLGLAHIFNPLFQTMVENDIKNFKLYMDVDAGDSMLVIRD